MLSQFLRAEHVRCLRVEGDDLRLASMSGDLEHGFWPGTPAPSLIQHVLTTGRRYIQGAPGNGELIGKLVAEWSVNSGAEDGERVTAAAPVWLVPVRRGNQTIGLVAAGRMPADVVRDLSTLQAVGHLVNLYWGFVDQARAMHEARSTDQVSGVLSRSDLVASAERILEQAAIEEEPVVLLALSVEGVRGLDDEGRWADRDWLIRQIGQALRGKLRSDDLVGRFSDDHFVAVLRRLDIGLGRIIAVKLVESAAEQVNAHPDLCQRVRVRCALCPRGGDGFETSLTRLFDALQAARRDEAAVVTVAGEDAEVRVAGMVEER